MKWEREGASQNYLLVDDEGEVHAIVYYTGPSYTPRYHFGLRQFTSLAAAQKAAEREVGRNK